MLNYKKKQFVIMKFRVLGVAAPHLNQVTKKVYHTEVRTIPVTNIRLYCRNYLNLSYTEINSPTKSRKLLSLLAIAIVNFMDTNFKKIKSGVYSTFETVIVISSLTLSTVHSILSPMDTSIILAIVAGSVVLTELFVAEPLLNFVFCLNSNTITSILSLDIIIFVLLTIYILSEKVIVKKVTFIYYLIHNNNHRIISRVAALENNLKITEVRIWKKLMKNT